MYTQCKLQREDNKIEVAYIPSEFAKFGKNIILGKRKDNGEKAKVIEVYGRTDIDMAKENRKWEVGGL